MSNTLEGHTLHQYDGELNHVHKLLIEMATLALDQVKQALYSFNEQNFEVASQVIDREHDVDELEKKIDEELIEVTARQAPVARDLRVVMAISKSVTDIERIGDEAAKIAHFTKEIFDNESADPSVHMLRDIIVMGDIAIERMSDAVEAMGTFSIEKAEAVLNSHSNLETEFKSSLRRLSTFILEDSRNVGHVLSIILILKALERIGEHAFNIAESVIFIVRGQDVRHSGRKDFISLKE